MRDLPQHMPGLLIKECYEISQMRLGLTGGWKRAGKKPLESIVQFMVRVAGLP